jgi:hypothetical protein
MENFNSVIEKALDISCQKKGISADTLQKIKSYLDLLALDNLSASEAKVRIQSILDGIVDDT